MVTFTIIFTITLHGCDMHRRNSNVSEVVYFIERTQICNSSMVLQCISLQRFLDVATEICSWRVIIKIYANHATLRCTASCLSILRLV